MARLSEFATDAEGAEGGKWFTIRPATERSPALRLQIRSANSKIYRTAQHKLNRKYRPKFIAGHGVLSVEDQDAYDTELCADTAVTAWDGMEQDDGTAIPYSKVKAREIFAEYAQLRREVFLWAQSEENFRPVEAAAEEINAMGKT